jgi:hypothetical protein
MNFLIPFSLFVELGHRLSWSAAPAISHPQLALVFSRTNQRLLCAAALAVNN